MVIPNTMSCERHFSRTKPMKSVLPKTPPASFFTPIGVGVLLQMACVGLVMAITVIGSAPGSGRATREIAENKAKQQAPIPPTPSPEISSATAPASADNQPQIASGESTTKDAANDESPKPEGALATADDSNSAERDLVKSEVPAMANTDAGESAPADDGAPVTADSKDVGATTPSDDALTAKPLDDIRARSRVLKIAGEGVAEEVTLCKIKTGDPKNVQLTLLDTEFPKLTMELEKLADEKTCRWSVRQVAALGFDRVQPVGEFQLQGQQLIFRWHKDADKGKLPFCRLKISAEDDSEVCSLWAPVRAAALRVSLDAKASEIAPFVPPGIQLPPPESVRLDFSLHDWPENEQAGSELMTSQTAEIQMSDADYGQVLLRIQLALRQDHGQLKVQSSWFTTIPKLPANKGSSDITYVEQPLKRTDLEKLTREMNSIAERWKKEAEDIDKDLEKTTKQLDNVRDMLNQTFRQDLSDKEDQLNQRCSELEDEKAVAGEIQETYSKAHAAMEKLTELCQNVEKNGRLEFQLVRPLERGASNLVISTSVEAKAAFDPP